MPSWMLNAFKDVSPTQKKKKGFSKIWLFLQAVLGCFQLYSQNCCFPPSIIAVGRKPPRRELAHPWAPSARLSRVCWDELAGRCSRRLPTKKCVVTSLCSFKLSALSESQIFQCYECQPLVVQVSFRIKSLKFCSSSKQKLIIYPSTAEFDPALCHGHHQTSGRYIQVTSKFSVKWGFVLLENGS